MAWVSSRSLWVWRVWRDGRLSQGFSPSEKDAQSQANLAQRPSHDHSQERRAY
jgi:hypothetical protein